MTHILYRVQHIRCQKHQTLQYLVNGLVSLKGAGDTWRAISGSEPCCPVLWRWGHQSYFQTPGMKGMFSPSRLPVKSVGDSSGVILIVNINKQGICETNGSLRLLSTTAPLQNTQFNVHVIWRKPLVLYFCVFRQCGFTNKHCNMCRLS